MKDRNKAKALNDVLQAQVREKQMAKDNEKVTNTQFMNKQLMDMEEHNKKRVDDENQRMNKRKENAAFLKS